MSLLTSIMHPLLTPGIIDDLRSKHIVTVVQFLQADIAQIASITTLKFKNIIVIQKHLLNKNSGTVWKGNYYYQQFLRKAAIVATGIKSIDDLLEGGLRTGDIYEICGLPVSGKTQLCTTIACNIAHDLNQNIYYLDAKESFAGKRVKQILESKENTPEMRAIDSMLKMFVKKVNSMHELVNALYAIKEEILKGLRLRVVLINSLPALMYSNSNRDPKYEWLNHSVNVMRFLATEHHVAFVVTNLVTNWYEGDLGQQTFSETLGMGSYWARIPNTRLAIETDDRVRKVSVVRSNRLRIGKVCSVEINNRGVV